MEKKKVIHPTKKTEPIKPEPINIGKLEDALWHLNTVRWALVGMTQSEFEHESEDLDYLLVDVMEIEQNLRSGLYGEKEGGGHE